MKILKKKYNDLSSFNIEFKNAKPYPHIILDNFLDKFFFENLDVEKIKVNKNIGANYNTDVEKKKWASKNVGLSKNISLIVSELYKKEFIKNLENLSKIKDLFSTNVGNIELANYHEMYESGFLGTHVDHSSEPSTGLPHVLNIILF